MRERKRKGGGRDRKEEGRDSCRSRLALKALPFPVNPKALMWLNHSMPRLTKEL